MPVRDKYALVRSQNVFDRQFDAQNLAFITDRDARLLDNVELRTGDVLLNITGDGVTFARSCLADPAILPARVNQHVTIIRCKEGLLEPGYLLSFLTHPQIKLYMESFNAGGSRRALTKGHIESFVIPLPPISEQRAIARILCSFDDKIELNRRTNATLEALVQAIFKSWFVDFDPVKAKAEGRAPEGTDADTTALFPSEFQDSELGLIPKGWQIKKVDELASVIRGKSYSSNELSASSTALVTLKSFNRGGGFRRDGFKAFTGKYKDEQVVKPGELIISYTDVTQQAEVIGKPAIVHSSPEFDTLIASLDLGIVRPKSPSMPTLFLYFLFLTPHFQDYIYGHTSGTTVLHLSKNGVPNYKFVCPPNELLRSFEQIALSAFTRIEINGLQSDKLTEIRDALLPKLVSGQLRMSDIEQAEGGL